MLDTVPLLFALAGLVLYTVLAGADFGAGLWQLLSGRGEHGRAIRDHAHHAIAPVWEANHVWLIFVITVTWTAFPVAFGSLASTLTIPVSVAALGIVFRGLAYALQSATDVPRERRTIDATFAISSILTPFMLGATIGAIASDRVPAGDAAGNLVTSWVNPTSILTGCLAVAVGAFLAAVYLAADAARLHDASLRHAFRIRALATGVVTGALAIAGLAVMAHDARHVYHGLTSGYGLAAVIVSGLAGIATFGLVWRSAFQLARISAALAVAAVLAGWAAAQRPSVLPGLTLQQAAAPRPTIIALIVAVLAGGLILAPSLALLFRLVLSGAFDHSTPSPPSDEWSPPATRDSPPRGTYARLSAAGLLAGFVLLTLAEGAVAHALGVIALLAAAALAFAASASEDALGAPETAEAGTSEPKRR